MPTTRMIGLCLVILGAAIGALLPVFLVLYPAAGIGQADAGRPSVVLPVLARNPALFVGPGILELVGHAVGAAAVIGLWMRWGSRSFLFTCATLGGLVWMSVDAIDNAIGLQLVPALATSFVGGDAGAGSTFLSLSALLDALRLAGHFAGGLWVAGISGFALRTGSTNRVIAWAGVATGLVLAANPIVPALLNVSFLTLPAWLILFGVAVARTESGREAALAPGLAMG
jgi:hypothetical protein